MTADLLQLEAGTPVAIPPLPPELRRTPDSLELREELLTVITGAIDAHPRSLQVRVGPSELGTPCARKLAYKLSGTPERQRDAAWRPTVGTAVHAWLAEQFVSANATDPVAPQHLRYAVECRVNVGEVGGVAIDGSCDLYDRVTATVIDWKVCGTTTLRKVKASGPSLTYRRQAHLYGRGWTRRGVPCERVAVMFLPNSGELSEAVWWSEPYDEQVALETLARADGIAAGLAAFGRDDLLRRLPATEDYCTGCAFLRRGSTDAATGCPGADRPRFSAGAGITSPEQFLRLT